MKEDHVYDALRNSINDDSGAEVEDWDVAENEVRPRTRRNRIWGILKSYRWVVDTFLLLLVVGLLLERRWTYHGSHRYEMTGDLTGFAPKCSFRSSNEDYILSQF